MAGQETKVKRIRLSDIEDVRTGIHASPILKRYSLPKEVDNLVFSVITKQRSLDLRANDPDTRNRWVKYLHTVVNLNNSLSKEAQTHQYQQLRQDTETQLERGIIVCQRYTYYLDKLGRNHS